MAAFEINAHIWCVLPVAFGAKYDRFKVKLKTSETLRQNHHPFRYTLLLARNNSHRIPFDNSAVQFLTDERGTVLER